MGLYRFSKRGGTHAECHDKKNQRLTIPKPVKIATGALTWKSEGYKNTWERKK
jgi:predicted DNA-binding transcriptional regulator AlpA